MFSFPETIRAVCSGFGRKKMIQTVTRLGNTGNKFAIGTVDDFLNIESSDAATQSLS